MKAFTKSWIILITISLTLIVLGNEFFSREGLLFALIISMGMNTYVYFYEDRRLLSLLSGQLLEGQDSFELQNIVRRLAARAHIQTPRIVILPIETPQAAALGRNSKLSTIALTQGALKKFTKPELEALLAYQIASIQSFNTFSFAVGSFIITFLLLITESIDWFLRLLIVEKRDPKVPVSQIFTRLAAPIFGFILRLTIRPTQYKNADRLATQLLGDGERLARVLWKLDSYAKTLPMTVSLATAHTFIVSPLTRHKWTSPFITQPLAAQRVKELIGVYPV